MAKNNKKKSGGNIPLPTARNDEQKKLDKPKTHPSHNGIRETFESLAIAFILAFLIRTFVVEPFVIPTGSMSPALRGVHKDLECPQCGHRYRVNASVDSYPQMERCVAGMCPMCRYTMAYDPQAISGSTNTPQKSEVERSYSGDRIIVNKFLYSFNEPERFDVVVFKYPGNATQNYIKRLVGLPEETLKIFGGDLFVKHDGDTEFSIVRKPPEVAYGMRQEVYDNERTPKNLHDAGWPFRWQPTEGWQVDASETGNYIHRRFTSGATGEQWLRYSHTVPDKEVWPMLEQGMGVPNATQQLVSDFNPYNTRVSGNDWSRNNDTIEVDSSMMGMHWVGDLYVDADVDVQQASGQLLLELVEAGRRFRATIDLKTGVATLAMIDQGQTEPMTGFAPTGKTPLVGTGKQHVVFGNVDDALYLWVNDKLVEFDKPTTYDWDKLFADRKQSCLPYTSDEDAGDLTPASVGTRDAQVVVDRLRVERDIYYIADKRSPDEPSAKTRQPVVCDYPTVPGRSPTVSEDDWDLIASREEKLFPIAKDQFFVMGDNSPQSSDARLWNELHYSTDGSIQTKPGGNYLERQLMIGRAISVVWPHSWKIVLPSFSDMRRIR